MKTEEEFEQFYRDELQKKVTENEELRKRTRRIILLSVYIPIVLFIFLFIFIKAVLYISIILFPVYIYAFVAIYQYNYEAYQTGFGNSIIAKMVTFLDERLKYDADNSIQYRAIKLSRLFMENKDSDGSNYIEGQVGETFIQFSEVNLNMGLGFGESTFKGIFLIASFNKNFKGDYFVFSGYHSNPYSNFFTNMKRLTFEYPEFNKEFTSYGSDEIEGRYIITSSMMQRMLDFKAKTNSKVYFSFTCSRMFVAISSKGVALFKPSIWHPVKYENLALWNRYLQFAIGVVEEFQLNTRIWSKR